MSQLKSVQEILNAGYDTDVNVNTSFPLFSYRNITTSAQTVVKSAPGILGSVHVGVATLTSAVRLYDNTVSGGAVIATLPLGASCGNYPFSVKFGTGLVVSSGAAADNITINYL